MPLKRKQTSNIMNEAKTPERTKFIQDVATMSFSKMYLTNSYYDLKFYSVFYRKKDFSDLKNSSNIDFKEIALALEIMPRALQTKTIMQILAKPEVDHSKQVKALVKLYQD
jgi:hypothetical protein